MFKQEIDLKKYTSFLRWSNYVDDPLANLIYTFRLKKRSFLGYLFLFISRIAKNPFSYFVFLSCYFYFNLDFYPFLYASLAILISDQSSLWLFKKNIRRARPSLSRPLPSQNDASNRSQSSMCSSHVANTSAFVLSLSLFYPPFEYYAYLSILLMALSRLYLLAHYLSDVLIGLCVGILSFYTIKLFFV